MQLMVKLDSLIEFFERVDGDACRRIFSLHGRNR
jgi:hypothetical protein